MPCAVSGTDQRPMPRRWLALQDPAVIVPRPSARFLMVSARYDVLGIGNAIVDVIARTEDDFLLKQGMNKGAMALIDEARAELIYDAMGPAVEISGGSAANTIVGLSSLGGRGAFVGKVKDDELGRAFSHDIRAAGVTFATTPASDGASTGRCYVLVTPDGERTMNTFLGAAQDLHPADIDADMIAASRIIYLEGYLWDPKNAKDAFLKAAKIAHRRGAPWHCRCRTRFVSIAGATSFWH